VPAAVLLVLVAAGCGGGDDAPEAAPVALRLRVGAGPAADVATAVVVGRDRALTVAHVLDAGAEHLRVGGVPARVLRRDAAADLALLAVPGVRAGPPALAEGRRGAARLTVLRAGGARALAVRVRRRVTATVRDLPTERVATRPALELGAAVEPGDSGAPVTDGDGRLVGVVFARSEDRAATAWAVRSAAVRRLLRAG
jgi:S1-C subfamily serine protease